jgi:5'-nucleotidase
MLAETLAEMAEVFVVAPDRERSGTGHGITVFDPIMIKRVDGIDAAQSTWVVYGTPVDCVKLGISALLPGPPDLVVSRRTRRIMVSPPVLPVRSVANWKRTVLTGIR